MNKDTEEKVPVAVLVHNDVYKDTRVRKGISTLVSQGFEVDVFGIKKDMNSPEEKFEGCHSLTLLESYPVITYIVSELKKRPKRILVSVAALIALATIAIMSTSVKLSVVVGLSLLFGLFGITAYFFRINLRNYIQYIYMRYAYNSMAGSLYRAIKDKSYEYIHCHDIIALIAGVKYKKSNPTTVLIWDAHELYEDILYRHKLQKRFIGKVISSSVKYIDKFITISDSFKSIYAKRYPALPNANVVMNATKYQSDGGIIDSPLRQEAGIAIEQKILLFQGGFAEGRGIRILLEAAKNLPKDWTVVFMGWGTLEGVIRQYGDSLNVGREEDKPVIRVLPPAPQEKLKYWTSGATLGIIPYENTSLNHLYCTPNKLWEYPNAGVPILATALVEIEAMILNWDTGLLLPREFSSVDIVDEITTITEKKLESFKEKCMVFSQEMAWQKFEAPFLKAYDR